MNEQSEMSLNELDVRRRFEKWARPLSLPLVRLDEECYINHDTDYAWAGFRAAFAQFTYQGTNDYGDDNYRLET
jgi:hypothetical protein